MDATTTPNYGRQQKNNPLSGAIFFIVLFAVWFLIGGIFLLQESERSIYKLINTHHKPLLDIVLSYVTYMGESVVIIPCLILLLLIPRFRTKKFTLAFIICNLTPFLVTQAIKALVNAPRPLNYFNEADWINRVAGQPVNYNYSFPSGHSEGAFAFFCFLALLLPKKYAALGIVFFLLALAVGYSRIYLSQHFYVDVFTGSFIGTVCCLVSFRLINPFKEKNLIQ